MRAARLRRRKVAPEIRSDPITISHPDSGNESKRWIPPEITLWSSIAPENTLPETINMKIPSTKKVNFFTMVPSVEFGIAVKDRRSGNIPQKDSHSRHRLTFVICRYRCTGDAKGEHAKSSRYEAKSGLLCKNLHESVLNLRFAPLLARGSNATRVSAKRLSMNDKAQLFGQMPSYESTGSLASQLHFIPVRHACCLAGR